MILNSGTITGKLFGIKSTGNNSEMYTNTGTIIGQIGAMSLSDAVSRVTNIGLFDGLVKLGGGGTGSMALRAFRVMCLAVCVPIASGAGKMMTSCLATMAQIFCADVGGEDSVYGGAGADNLRGGADNDYLFGGIEADISTGGTGYDRLSGGAGTDTFVFFGRQGTDRVADFLNNVDKLDLRAFDFDGVAAVQALSSAAAFGLRIDVPGEGLILHTD